MYGSGERYVSTENSQMAFTGAVFSFTYHKATKSMAKLITQPCGELQLAVCLSRGDGAIYKDHALKHLWTSNKPQKQVIAKAVWELSVLISA